MLSKITTAVMNDLIHDPNFEYWLNRQIEMRLEDKLPDVLLHELDPEKNYILIVPTDVDEAALRKELNQLRGKVNLLTIRSDNVTLLELT